MSWVAAAVAGGAVVSGYMQSRSADKAADAQVDAAGQAAQIQWDMYNKSRKDAAPWKEAGEYGLNALTGGYNKPKPKRKDYMVKNYIQPDSQTPQYSTSRGRDAESGGSYRPTQQYQDPFVTEKFRQNKYDKDYKNYLDSYEDGMIAKGPGEFSPEEDPGYKFGYEEFIENPTLKAASATGKLRSGATQKALTRYASDYASTKYDNFLSRYYDTLKPYQSLAGMGQTSANNSGANAIATGRGVAATQMGAGDARASGYINKANVWGNVASGVGQNALDSYYQNQNQQPYMSQGVSPNAYNAPGAGYNTYNPRTGSGGF